MKFKELIKEGKKPIPEEVLKKLTPEKIVSALKDNFREMGSVKLKLHETAWGARFSDDKIADISKIGPLGLIFETVALNVDFFGDSYNPSSDDPGVGGTIGLGWTHVGGGSNGFTLGNLWFSSKTGDIKVRKEYGF